MTVAAGLSDCGAVEIEATRTVVIHPKRISGKSAETRPTGPDSKRVRRVRAAVSALLGKGVERGVEPGEDGQSSVFTLHVDDNQ